MRGGPFHNDVLVNFHVRHGGVLTFQTALVPPFATAEKRQFPETCISISQHTAQKVNAQSKVVSVHFWILDGLPDFARKFRRKDFVCVQQQNPFMREWQSIHCPLPFLGPSSLV